MIALLGPFLPYIIGGVGLLIGGYAVYHGIESRGAEAQAAKDAPIIQQWKDRASAAEGANATLQADVGHLRDLANSCNAKVDAISKVGAEAQAAVAAAIAASRERSRSVDAQLSRFLAGTKANASGTPQQQCDAAVRVLGELSDQMRGAAAEQPKPPASAVPVTPTVSKPAETAKTGSLPSAIRKPKP